MKTHSPPSHIGILLVLIAVLGAVNLADAQQIVTNWAAYNDHRAGPAIPPHVPTAASWGTALRVTRYDMGAPGNTMAASLTNFYNGQQLPVTMSVIRTGAPDDFGTIAVPFTNTPAGDLFYRIADLSNVGIVGVDAGLEAGGTVDFVTFTFNGLNPDKRYLFRGTSCRGANNVTRWSVATITNVNGYIDAHIDGSGTDPFAVVLTESDFSPDLGPGQAAWNSGDNREGAVIGWDFIAPMPDGSFSIMVHQYTGRVPNNLMANDVNYGYSFGAILLAEVEASPPVITQNPPAQTTLEQNRPFSLSVLASGTPLLYQWYKEGVGPISGATFRTYSVSQAAVADSGDYYVVVYNPLNRATSTVARVTVNADVTAPSVLSAFSFPSFVPATQVATLDTLTVEFNEAVQPASINDPSYFTISGGVGNPVSVILTNDRTAILVLSAPLPEDTDYTVQVVGVTDLALNTAETLTQPFHTWVRGPGNSLLYEYYDTGAGVDVAVLTNSPVFPNNPSFRTNLWAFETRVVFPNDDQANFGARISGVFIPPFSGDWVFFLRVWDRGLVYFNPNGMDPAGKIEILHDVTGNNPRDWNKFSSAPFRLQGGQGYYIEALQKAEGATDALKVAARPAGTGFPTLGVPDTQFDTNSLMGGYIASPLAPRDLGGTLTISQQPANQTVEENHDVTFSVGVNNPSRAPLSYQWSRNGLEVPGANGPTYTFPVTAGLNETVSVRVAKVGSVVFSDTATVTVVQDTTPPAALQATSSYTNLFEVMVLFSERMIEQDVQDQFSYVLSGDQSTPASIALGPDGRTATLTFNAQLISGTLYELQIFAVRDLGSNSISPNPTTLTFVGGHGGLPDLRIAASLNDIQLSWLAPSTGFVLQEANDVVSATWNNVATAPVVANGRNTVTLTRPSVPKFYRLQSP